MVIIDPILVGLEGATLHWLMLTYDPLRVYTLILRLQTTAATRRSKTLLNLAAGCGAHP